MREDTSKELIFSMLLDGKGGAVKYNWDDIDAWSPEKGVLWMHLSLPEDPTNNWVNKRSGISKTLSEALLNGRNRPRILKEEDKLFLSLRAINLNPGADTHDSDAVSYLKRLVYLQEYTTYKIRKYML